MLSNHTPLFSQRTGSMSLQPNTSDSWRISCGFVNFVFLVLHLFPQLLNANLFTQIQNQLQCSVKYEECRSKFSAECRMILSKESVRLQVMQLLVFCFEIYLVSLGCKLYIAIFVLVSIWGSDSLFSFHCSKDL